MQINEALNDITAFLKNIRFEDSDFDISQGITTFHQTQIGGMALTGSDRSTYIACLNGLITAVEDELSTAIKKNGANKDNSFSRKGLERLLQTTLLKAWNAEEGLNQIPENRIQTAIKWLRKELTSPPMDYLVYMAVTGVDQSHLPVKIGKLTFVASKSTAARELRELTCNKLIPSDPGKDETIGAKQQINDMLKTVLASTTLIELQVRAGDEDSARERAVTIGRQTIDVINFFADIFFDRESKACIALVGEEHEVVDGRDERKSTKLAICVVHHAIDDEERVAYRGKYVSDVILTKEARGPLLGMRLPNPELSWRPGSIEELFARLSQVLVKDTLSPLEDRIVSAFQWAGRAMRVVTKIDLPPITIIDVSRGPQRAAAPLASSLLSQFVVPFPLVSWWRNGERTDDLAQTLIDQGTSFCVEPQRPCPKPGTTLRASRPRGGKRTAKSARI
jgi:hypothetical protein